MGISDRFLEWWLRGGRYSWSRLRRKLLEGKYLKVELPAVSSLEEIELCLKQVTWTRDSPLHLFDYISYPQAVWARKKDDCDGFAVLAATLLHRWFPETSPVLLTVLGRPIHLSHTVCALKWENRLWFFDNDTLRREDCQQYADVTRIVAQGITKPLFWDVVEPEGLETLEFYKVEPG